MNWEEFTDGTSRTWSDKHFPVDPNLDHAVMGLVDEAAELSCHLKKVKFYGAKLDPTNIKEEIGDSLFFIARIAHIFGWSIEEIMDTNQRKLRKRFPDKFTSEKALVRDLGAERQELEK